MIIKHSLRFCLSKPGFVIIACTRVFKEYYFETSPRVTCTFRQSVMHSIILGALQPHHNNGDFPILGSKERLPHGNRPTVLALWGFSIADSQYPAPLHTSDLESMTLLNKAILNAVSSKWSPQDALFYEHDDFCLITVSPCVSPTQKNLR